MHLFATTTPQEVLAGGSRAYCDPPEPEPVPGERLAAPAVPSPR
jgi:hypothetical protein